MNTLNFKTIAVILLFAAAATGQEANDTCSFARPVWDGAPATVGDNLAANAADDAEAACQPDSSHDVWFEYVAWCDGTVTIDARDSGQLDTVLSVYDACGGAEVACNDDYGDSLRSVVGFLAIAGQSYRIRLASYAEPGDYRLDIACRETPENDLCTNGVNIRVGSPAITGNNSGAAPVDDAEASCRPDASHDVWFAYRARCAGPVTIDTFGSGQPDPSLSVYDGCGGTEIACNDDAAGGATLQAEVTFMPVYLERYWVRLASLDEPGPYQINVRCLAPPENDDCATAEALDDGTAAAQGDNSFAESVGTVTASCAPSADHDVWYLYTASCDGIATIDTLGSAVPDPVLTVYGGCGGAEVACNDDANGLQAAVSFAATAGQTYPVRVATNGSPGAFKLNVHCAQTPANDACATAAPITDGAPAVVVDNTLAAAINDAEAPCAPASAGDVWFHYVATCDGTVTVETGAAQTVDTVLTVYDVCGGNTLACSDDAGNSVFSAASFSGVTGTSYWIRAATVGEPGRFEVDITCHGAPANDDCENPQPAHDAANALNTEGASTDGPDHGAGGPCDFGAVTDVSSDVWFCYAATCNGIATFDLCAAQYDSKLAVYRGCTCPNDDPAACNDDACGSVGSRVSIPVELGEDVLVRVGGNANAQGAGSLVISCEQVGACCGPQGCSVMAEHECTDDEQVFMGGGTSCAGDADHDGVASACDRCVQSKPGIPVDFTGCQRGDFDVDGDVDIADYVQFQDCMAGPELLPAPAQTTSAKCLDAFDGTEDGDVDLEDFRRFMRNFGG